MEKIIDLRVDMAQKMEYCYHLLSIILHLNFFSCSIATTEVLNSKTDRSALVSFKSQISGDPFGALSSWNESLHHCQWQGVQCGRHHPDRVTAFVLDSKQLSGYISPSLTNLTFLRMLSLSNNRLQGSIPSELGFLGRLRFVNLSMNFLNGGIPSTLANCSNLQVIQLRSNELHGTIPSNLVQCKKLKIIDLGLNYLMGGIPPEFGTLFQLNFLSLFSNNFTGHIPYTLGNLSSLTTLDLGDNNFDGFIADSLGKLSNLSQLSIKGNKLIGPIPHTLGNLTNIVTLDLSFNILNGSIPNAIGNLLNLQKFYIYNNVISGKIPNSLFNLSSLVDLQLQYNRIEGTLPFDSCDALPNLQYLHLYSNQLNGQIPPSISNCSALSVSLDLSDNYLTGILPPEIGQLKNIQSIRLSNNKIYGEIPSTIDGCQVLQALYLDSNMLRGTIPSSLSNLRGLQELDVSNNSLTGTLPPEIGQLKNIQSICLSNNKIYGELPGTIDGCQVLQALYLDSNMLRGTIPSSLSNLRGLQELHVSNNSFSGPVPEFLGRMNLQSLDISFNNFEGKLPNEGIFMDVSGLEIRGNPKLCGGVPRLHLSRCILEPPTRRHHSRGNMVLISSIVGSFILLTIVACISITCYSRDRSQNNQQSDNALKYELKHISYNELLRATENFSSKNLIGRGSFGAVYKASMSFDNLTAVAVKVITLENNGAARSFFTECEALRNVRHRNLLKVLSACSSIDHQGNNFKALVFEFMPNGSLAAWLHPNAHMNQPSRSLSLVERLNIAIDVAAALDYLHYHGPTPIVHCDLKPGNVLLDDNMTAHVGDFGLARFLVQPDTTSSQSITSTGGIKGSIGYIPPEYGMGGRPSVEGDVYSYGILLLEMFTGVSPTDEKLIDGVSLHKHIEMAFPAQVMDIVDSKLFSQTDGEANTYTSENVFGCLLSVIQCALMCSKEFPKERIAIKDVVKQLNSARQKFLNL